MVFIGCLVYTRCFRTLALPLPHLNLYSCYNMLQMRKPRLGEVKQFAYITTVKCGVMVLRLLYFWLKAEQLPPSLSQSGCGGWWSCFPHRNLKLMISQVCFYFDRQRFTVFAI